MAEEAGKLLFRFFRFTVAQKQLKVLRKKNIKRQHLLKEILSTEEVYVANLEVLAGVRCFGVYLNPLRACVNGPEPLCSSDDLRNIFSNLEGILAFHFSLLKSMSEKIAQWTSSQCIGEVFLHMIPYLKLYTSYCNNYDTALKVFSKCKENEQFARFFRVCSAFPETQNLTFLSFLIMPVQRIPRYRMLLEELVENTLGEHPDYQQLTQALEGMKEVADFVNHQMRISKSYCEIQRVVEKIGAPRELLSCSNRFFVAEGNLKQLKPSGTVRTLYYYLLSDKIIFAVSSRVFQKNSKTYESVVSLPGCWLNPFDSNDKEKFQLEFVTEGDCYQFLFPDKESSDVWRDLIQKTVAGLYERQPGLIRNPFPRVMVESKPRAPDGGLAKCTNGETTDVRPTSPPVKTEGTRSSYRLRRYNTVNDRNKSPASRTPLSPSIFTQEPTLRNLKGMLSKRSTTLSDVALVPDRESAVQEGFLRKRGQYDIRWKKRFFSIIDNVLYYYKSDEEKIPLGSVPLKGSFLVAEEKDFVIQLTSGSRVVYLSASTKVEQAVWVQTLRSR